MVTRRNHSGRKTDWISPISRHATSYRPASRTGARFVARGRAAIYTASRGWRVVDAHTVASTPWDYQGYIQDSFGEFSCAKPSYLRLENAWVSDRTLCYLASGKPAVVQYTGRSRFLPDSAGVFRFRDVKDAADSIERVVIDYEKQCKLARDLAEEYFDARKVVAAVLEQALS